MIGWQIRKIWFKSIDPKTSLISKIIPNTKLGAFWILCDFDLVFILANDRSLSLLFTDGDECEVTGKRRLAEVRLKFVYFFVTFLRAFLK